MNPLWLIGMLFALGACSVLSPSPSSHSPLQQFGPNCSSDPLCASLMQLKKSEAYQPPCQGGQCTVTEALHYLAAQLNANVKHRSAFPAVLATSFVNLDNLDDTSPLGRLLTEGLVARLQVLGWNIYDVRFSRAVAVTPEGEFVLSRDPKRLEYQYAAAAALTGTYSVGQHDVLIHARITDTTTNVVVSSAEVRMPIDSEIARLLTDHDQLKPMRIIRGQ